MTRRNVPGTVYMLHFSEPYKHARHYTGWASDLDARLAEHEQGRGARLTAVAKAAGITRTIARTWPGTRARERQLKNQGGASRHCPDCGVKPRDPRPPQPSQDHREETRHDHHRPRPDQDRRTKVRRHSQHGRRPHPTRAGLRVQPTC